MWWWCVGKCSSQARLTGKTAIITGGNSGIGKETAKDFYKRGEYKFKYFLSAKSGKTLYDKGVTYLSSVADRFGISKSSCWHILYRTCHHLLNMNSEYGIICWPSEEKANTIMLNFENLCGIPGARVIIACRSLERANQAVQDIKQQCEQCEGVGTLVVHHLDLNNLSLVRKAAARLLESESRIDLLINNAGIMITPNKFTDDGYESHFGVNHLGHFLFTLLLLPRIIQSAPARIVTVSSADHDKGWMNFDDLHWQNRTFRQFQAYGQSKLANILFSKELARRLEANGIEGVTTYALHPGNVKTELARHIDLAYPGVKCLIGCCGSCLKTPEQGAQTTIHCAVNEKLAKETGLYYNECRKRYPSFRALKKKDAKKLWEVSVELTGLQAFDPFKK